MYRFRPVHYHAFYSRFSGTTAKIVERLKERMGNQKVALIADIGAGTGITTELLASSFQEATVTGIDIRPSMLRFASKTSSHPNAKYRLLDTNLQSLPLPQDLIFFKGSYHLWQRSQNDLKAFFRSNMQPWGRICIVKRTPDSIHSFPLFEGAWQEWEDSLQCNSLESHLKVKKESFVVGNWISLPLHTYCKALRKKQISFLSNFSKRALTDWAKHLNSMRKEILVWDEFEIKLFQLT